MKRIACWVSLLFIASINLSVAQKSDTTLQAKPIFGRQAWLISNLLERSHYRKLQLNDSLSSAIFDSYILALDNNKSFFLASDIASFEKYRYQIDDLTKKEDVSVAFVIYKIFRKRFMERMNYSAAKLINADFDYSANEYFEADREKSNWASTEQELNVIWAKLIKNQALGLKLAGKSSDEIRTTLNSRNERYIKSVNQTNSMDVFSTYMNAITEAYDPHTNYFSPRQAEVFDQQTSQSLEGIGARLQTENEYTKVNEILPGGPAEKSDLIHVNDRIVGVAQGENGDFVDVVGWRLDEVVKLIKGPKGTMVRLQIITAESGINGAAITISLVRDKIKLEDATAKKKVIESTRNGKNLKLGVITIPTFYMDFEAYQKGDPNYNSLSRDVKKIINELQTEGVQGMVIDLRNNGGGSLQEAINLTGLFIKNGPVVQVRTSSNRTEVLTDDDASIAYNGPLVVLTNRFSASASEIFAGAIQDYKRGVIVGESTYGKGTVQQVIDLNRFINDKEEVGSLKLTLQKFYRASGSSTQHKGVIPDIMLPTALNAEQFGESSNASALPWDEIRGTLYQRTPIINDKVLGDLNKSYSNRLKNDPYLLRFIEETDETRKSISQNNISLNESKRKKELNDAEQKKAANKKMGNIAVDKEGKPLPYSLNLDDEYLREGLLILTDLITSKIG